MPTWLAQHENENGIMEAACLQAVSKHSANIGGAGALRLHPRYILGRRIKKKGRIEMRQSGNSYSPV